MEVSDIRRTGGFEFLPQVEKELKGLPPMLTAKAIGDFMSFESAWREGASQQVLSHRFSFKKAHHAECAHKGILLYEIYLCGQRYRAIAAWCSTEGPGYWVAIFKKQGTQSKGSILTAGDRAVCMCRLVAGQEGKTHG